MKRMILTILTAISLLSFTSCDDIFWRDYSSILDKEVVEFVESNYPGSKIVDVDLEGRYSEVEIRDGRIHRTVYFDRDNCWIRTESDLRYRDLPTVVAKAIKESKYGDFRVDDIDLIETPQEEYYIIDLERRGMDVELKISINGEIL